MGLVLTPYLNFNGTCEAAMNFYQAVLGGELAIIRFKDMPMNGEVSESEEVMHSTLKANNISLMASDSGMRSVIMGDSVNLFLAGSASDDPKLRGFFSSLSAGGTVSMPLSLAPWGAEFGMFTDKYGINWMINIETES